MLPSVEHLFCLRHSAKYINEGNNIYFIIFSRTLVFLVKDGHKCFRINDRCIAIFKYTMQFKAETVCIEFLGMKVCIIAKLDFSLISMSQCG